MQKRNIALCISNAKNVGAQRKEASGRAAERRAGEKI